MRTHFFLQLLILIALLIFDSLVYSQTQSSRFKHLTVKEGLSNSSVKCFYQDSDGFIWIGTQDGLNKYDGVEFKVYQPKKSDSTSISARVINAIYQDKHNKLWVATSRGLNLFDKNSDSFSRPINELYSQNITCMLEDSKGNFWFGTKVQGVYKFTNNLNEASVNQLKSDHKVRFKGKSINCLLEDKDGLIWLGVLNEGLYSFDPQSEKLTKYSKGAELKRKIISNKVNNIYQDKHGDIWVGTMKGISKIEKRSGEIKNYVNEIENPNSLINNIVFSMFENYKGELWFVTDGGLARYNPGSDDFSSVHPTKGDAQGLSTWALRNAFIDRQNTIWIATYSEGIDLLELSNMEFEHVKNIDGKYNSLSPGRVKELMEDGNGDLWIGFAGSGIDYFRKERNNYTNYIPNPEDENGLIDWSVLAICEDRRGNIWIGGQKGGLTHFNREDETFTGYRHDPDNEFSISNNNVWDIIEDDNGDIWVAMIAGGGINRFNVDTKQFFRYTMESHGLANNSAIKLYKDSKGDIWIGTFNGVSRFSVEKDKVIANYQPSETDANSLPHAWVYAILEDSDKQIWIGTVGGLSKLNEDGKGFTSYTTEDGLANDVINDLFEDDNKNLWMSTNKGITMFNPAKGEFRNYDESNGLQVKGYVQGAACKTSSGELLFGGHNGYNSFNPSKIKTNEFVPNVVITKFSIFDKVIKPGQENSFLQKHISQTEHITITYKESVFSFEFVALNLVNPQRNQYAYMMVGFEEEWRNTTSKNLKAVYTNLDPGDYVFKVKASNNDGVWNEKGASIKLTILPPWWETWWFRITAIIVVLLGVVVFIRLRTLKLRQNQKILEDKVRKATADVKARNAKLAEAREKLKNIMDDVKFQLGDASKELLNASNNQAATAEEVSASMEQMSSEISENAAVTEQVLLNVKKVEDEANESVEIVSSTLSSISDVSEGIGFISEFARMTNLLSLNAAIEAARAGVHGRSFSVVASQVKKLADQSAEVAINIKKLSEKGLQLSQSANSKIINLQKYILEIVNAINEINNTSQNQSIGAVNINEAMQQMSVYISNTSGLASKLDDAISSLTVED